MKTINLSNQQKLKTYLKHRFDAENKIVKKHESAEARFEQVINEKILGLNQFAKQAKISTEDKAYIEAKEKIESYNKREQMLAKRKADRKARKENAAKRTTEKMIADIKHFLESEARRKAKQEEKRSKYSGKKKKVAPRPITEDQLKKKVPFELKKYYIVLELHNADHTEQYDSEPVVLTCASKSLHKRLADFHKKHSEQYGDEYVGTYVYSEETCSHCILESINSKYYNINGYLTSRMAAQRAAAAA